MIVFFILGIKKTKRNTYSKKGGVDLPEYFIIIDFSPFIG